VFEIDKIQTKQIRILFVAVAAIGGLTALWLYPARKKSEKQKHELFELDKQIKELELRKLKKEVGVR
jgi:hypothetical protein